MNSVSNVSDSPKGGEGCNAAPLLEVAGDNEFNTRRIFPASSPPFTDFASSTFHLGNERTSDAHEGKFNQRRVNEATLDAEDGENGSQIKPCYNHTWLTPRSDTSQCQSLMMDGLMPERVTRVVTSSSVWLLINAAKSSHTIILHI